MPQPTVTITAPIGDTVIPTNATGTAEPTSGATLIGMAYQIDSGSINTINRSCYPVAGGSWTFPLSKTDCPQLTSYLLTVYAGDSSGNFGTDSVNLTRTA